MKGPTDNPRMIDEIRNSGGSLEIGTPDDGSPIKDMISAGDRLLVIKGKGIYAVKLADQVDPERTNIATPNTVQRVIPYGADDPWVGAVVLTAHNLFQNPCSLTEVDGAKAFSLVLDIAGDIAGAYQLEERYSNAEKTATENLDPSIRKDRSFVVPTVGNVEARCKEFLQRADHALSNLFRLVQIFYPNISSGGWESLKKKIDGGSQDVDNFAQFLANALPFLQLIRNARNCVEHPRPEQRLVVNDFSLDSKNMLLPPMLEIIHPKLPGEKAPVALFFKHSLQSLVDVVELMMVFLCARHVKSLGGLSIQIIELPKDRRRSEHVRYGYGALLGGELVPMG